MPWFQVFACKCNLYRYNEAQMNSVSMMLSEQLATIKSVVGRGTS
jgi:hypothetical protein